MKRRYFFFVVLYLFSHTGCNALAPGFTPTPTATPTPLRVTNQAGEKMLAVNGLHFIMSLSGSLTYLDDPPTMALKHVEGDVALPDQVRALVRIMSLGVISEVGIIGLGEEQYVTNPLNQKWQKLPEGYGWYFNPALLFDPEYGIEAILREGDWVFGTTENEEDSKRVFVLKGQVPGEQLFYLTSGMIVSGAVDVEIWVEKESFYVTRIKLTELESDPENPTQWVITLSDFDNTVEITAPPVEKE